MSIRKLQELLAVMEAALAPSPSGRYNPGTSMAVMAKRTSVTVTYGPVRS